MRVFREQASFGFPKPETGKKGRFPKQNQKASLSEITPHFWMKRNGKSSVLEMEGINLSKQASVAARYRSVQMKKSERLSI